MNLRDERGFVHIYLMGLFSMVCVIILAMMLATFAGARKNAVAAYSWLTEAADFAAHTAVMNGVTAADYEDAPQVETYFTTASAALQRPALAAVSSSLAQALLSLRRSPSTSPADSRRTTREIPCRTDPPPGRTVF